MVRIIRNMKFVKTIMVIALNVCIAIAAQAHVTELDSIVNSGRFTVEVNRVQPVRSASVYAHTVYSLKLSNDSVYSNLPYIGRSYNVSYTNNEGLSMEESITNYKIREKENGIKEIFFNCRSKNNSYSYRLKVYPDASVRIHISTFDKQPIFFDGKIKLP